MTGVRGVCGGVRGACGVCGVSRIRVEYRCFLGSGGARVFCGSFPGSAGARNDPRVVRGWCWWYPARAPGLGGARDGSGAVCGMLKSADT